MRHQVRGSAPGHIALQQAAQDVQAGGARSGFGLGPVTSYVLSIGAGHVARPLQTRMGASNERQPARRPIAQGRVVFRT